MTRVVITGIGVVSPVGNGREEFWAHLAAGRSGIGPITLFDASEFPVRIGGEVRGLDFPALGRSFPAATACRDRKVLLGLAAAGEALLDARLSEARFERASLHVGVGLEMLHLEDLTPFAAVERISLAIAAQLPGALAGRLLQTPLDTTADLLGERYGFGGGRFTNCSACAAGAQSVGEAFHMVRAGRVELALAGATDSMLNPLGLGGFSLLRVLSARNDSPPQACRPFDASRQGTALGEGAAFLVLERLDHALARGARCYSELLGYGSSMDGFRVSDPEPGGRGAVRSMAAALADAGLSPGQIDCVNAHGTGTPKNDVVETLAIKDVLGDRAYEVPVHAVKSMTGHMIAASGAVEAAAAALTLHHRCVPPTINLDTPDPECDLDYVPGRAREFAGQTVLSNSFGFGGQNATLIFGRCS
ncbi:MAG: beta-ketoacyl-[acyl-carrier-protein] synthase family protein [Planctomycetota bacterium]|nr:beta-ketoacyl-[acyl-carrier-protein] synthase family protein [Planctomycetota bacterium]